jgi:hypothetical protein
MKGRGRAEYNAPFSSLPYFPTDLRINSFKDDVTIFRLLGVFFLLEPQEKEVPLL